MDDAKVELLGHHRCLCTQLPFGSAGGNLCARRSTESPYRGRGGGGSPHHRAGGASDLAACFGTWRTTFARSVSWVFRARPEPTTGLPRTPLPRTSVNK